MNKCPYPSRLLLGNVPQGQDGINLNSYRQRSSSSSKSRQELCDRFNTRRVGSITQDFKSNYKFFNFPLCKHLNSLVMDGLLKKTIKLFNLQDNECKHCLREKYLHYLHKFWRAVGVYSTVLENHGTITKHGDFTKNWLCLNFVVKSQFLVEEKWFIYLMLYLSNWHHVHMKMYLPEQAWHYPY